MIHKKVLHAVVICAVLVGVFLPTIVHGQQGNFSLQVTPSPLVLSIKPGDTMTTELKIRNGGDKPEKLKIEPRSFNLNGDTGDVSLNDSIPSDIASWITFSNPTFTILPGQWFTEKITISLPKQAGFSYSFALIISRASDTPVATPGEAALRGSVAVFTLISVDRPDAKKQLEATKFSASKNAYEYLPVTLTTTFKNTGNTIVQPYGNIFIQRTNSSSKPISTIPVNEGHGYILPGSSRSFEAEWSEGFPKYKSTQPTANESPVDKLSWDWSQASNFRFGRYTAKLVAVYSDGTRDIPLDAQTTFLDNPMENTYWTFDYHSYFASRVIYAYKKGGKNGKTY